MLMNWVLSSGALQQSETEAPNIAGVVVRFVLDALRRHVLEGPHEGATHGNRVL